MKATLSGPFIYLFWPWRNAVLLLFW